MAKPSAKVDPATSIRIFVMICTPDHRLRGMRAKQEKTMMAELAGGYPA